MSRSPYQRGVFARTGRAHSAVPLDCLLYLLLRDWVPVGRLGDLIEHARNCSPRDPHTFTDGHLAEVAKRLRRRLS